ncbi:MAG TPA: thiolase family protein [Syntrophales bacterium]|nr:thiolase family protein [Syntrophales bacterium]
MGDRVAIVSVAQSPGAESKDNFYDQAYRVARECLDKAGLGREDVDTVVSASSDIFHGGISCANAYYWDTTGAFLKNASRQDGESLFAFMYAVMRIMTGHYETALVIGLCKGSENPPNDACTVMFADPFYQRDVGLTETLAAALQMNLYMERYGITREQCAAVAAKNLGNALKNPYAHRKGKYTVSDILRSPTLADPLTELQAAPKSEGMIAMLLASEAKAGKLTDKPVWFKGYGSSLDTYTLGDRDLLRGELTNAAKRAYDMAGIKNPKEDIDVAEICEPYAFQELLWSEDLGFCGAGEGGKFLESGATQIGGSLPINPSGGVLANNPYVSRGLQRLIEATLQVRGEAGEHQVPKSVKTALAHGTHGFAGQCHAVAIIGR